MVVNNVIDRIVSDMNRIVGMVNVRRTITWRSDERMIECSVDRVVHIDDKLVGRHLVVQMKFDVCSGAIKFFDERRADVKRVLFSEHRGAP